MEPSDAKLVVEANVSAGVRRAALFDNFLGGLTPENAALLVKKHGTTESLVSIWMIFTCNVSCMVLS